MNLFKHFFTIVGIFICFCGGVYGQNKYVSEAKARVNNYITEINGRYNNGLVKKLSLVGVAEKSGYFFDLVQFDFGRQLLKNLNSNTDVVNALEITRNQYYPGITAATSSGSATGTKAGAPGSVHTNDPNAVSAIKEKAYTVYFELLSDLKE